jgi:hypothetical protein
MGDAPTLYEFSTDCAKEHIAIGDRSYAAGRRGSPDTSEEVAGSQSGSHPDGQLARELDGDEHPPSMRAEVTDCSERAWMPVRESTDQKVAD